MRGEALLTEMDSMQLNFNVNPELDIPQLNCENIQAFMLNFPQNIKNKLNETLYKIDVAFENSVKDFSEFFKNLWNTIKNTCKELYKFL